MSTLFFIILMVKMHQILSDDVQRNEKFFRKTLPKEFRNQTRSTKTVPHQNEKICDYCRLSPHNTYCLHRQVWFQIFIFITTSLTTFLRFQKLSLNIEIYTNKVVVSASVTVSVLPYLHPRLRKDIHITTFTQEYPSNSLSCYSV